MKASYARPERREPRNDLSAGQLFVVDLISRNRGFRTFGIVLNISQGGMAVQTFRPLAAGHITEIRHCFSKAPIYTGAGQVVWKKENGLAGLRFLNGRLKNMPELCQHDELDASLQGAISTQPLAACRTTGSADAFESTLHLLVCSAMAICGATGAAIVLGDSRAMQCRASAGIAPEVGTQLSPESGLSGHSMRTGSVILCHDAWADPRVNMAAARQMETRSILIVPITMAGSVVGMIEAFSPEINHFDQRHVERLEPLVTVLASVPELENVSASQLPEELAAVVGAQNASEDSGYVQRTELELLGEIAEKFAESAPAEEAETPGAEAELETDGPDFIAALSSSELPRSRSFPTAIGLISALLIVLAAMAFFTFRLRHQAAQISHTPVSPQSSPAPVAAIVAPKPEIAFDPPAVVQKPNANFGVNIVLKNSRDILSVPLRIHYDPQKLRVVTVASGGLFDRAGQPGTLDRRVDAAAGTIDLTISRTLPTPEIYDSGALVTLTFVSKAAGHSQLQLDPVDLHDSSNRVTPLSSVQVAVDVSSTSDKPAATPAKPSIAPTKPATAEASPATAKKESPAQSAASGTKSAQPPPAEAKAAPQAPPTDSSSAAPAPPNPESGALIVKGISPGTEVWFDNQPFTATAATVAIRNVPAGTHHLRLSVNSLQYYDNIVDVKPGEVFSVEAQTH
jgi:hypothetical protein